MGKAGLIMGKEYGKLVSIVVPVYNVELYLTECLDSLVGQIYENIEILLIDDGSTDRSGDICDQYMERDRRIKVLHKENGGVSSARNSGIDLMSGEYLIFVDADDYIHKELVEIYMENVEIGYHLLCDHVSDSAVWRESYQGEWRKKKEIADRSEFMELYYRDYINPPFNKLYQASIIKERKIRFPLSKNLGEDLMFNLDYYRYIREPYCLLHCPLYYYRENRMNSLSNSYKADLFKLQQELFSELKQFLEDTGIWTSKNAKIYYGMYWDRLYLVAEACRAYEEEHPRQQQLVDILRAPIWKSVWKECKKRKVLNIKRRIKWIRLKMIRFYNEKEKAV